MSDSWKNSGLEWIVFTWCGPLRFLPKLISRKISFEIKL